MKQLTYFLLLFLFLGTACSEDDPEVIIETVTVRDTIIVVQFDTTVVIQVDTTVVVRVDTSIIIVRDTTVIVQVDTIINTISDDSSVVVVCVRHAETTGAGSNPPLSAAGITRAGDLSHALSNTDLTQVYATIFNRTRQTADVSATDQGLSTTIYDAFNISGFASDLLQQHKGETVLAVGHSNTTPQLINALTSTTNYSTFNENTYDNLFIVKIKINGEAVVYHLEYGADTP